MPGYHSFKDGRNELSYIATYHIIAYICGNLHTCLQRMRSQKET